MTTSREIRLKSRPVGVPTAENFELASVELAPPGDGEIQVKNLYMSVDPYMRGRMTDRKSYVPPFELGKALQGGAVGEVTASNDPDFKVGDLVSSMFGWREAYNAHPKALAAAGPMGGIMKLSTHGMPPQAFLGVAGMPGMTAYAGLLRVAGLKEGDVVFVSAAAGAVGSVVCQIAKIKGHTVIGSAGGPEKVAFLKSIGVDHVIDYKATPDVVAELAKVAPKGIDVYFENVGGAHLEAALNSARPFGRFALCGMISQYNDTGRPTGPANIIQAVGKSLRLEGFIVSNHYDLFPAFVRDMADWIGSGKLTWKDTVLEGVDRAPEAFIKLFSGENLGKMLVKL
ncbi:NADP-dependent oxidoreductase [Caulobacter sp. D4A]|uniref:NADP-dependent oxidoreductase n=1 Tax=unclassified Caulobacter TaxID=2648921 RepID=UPI000D72F80A|nr:MULTISPECIES: NADP-dependent oxidoreductase [unclassified Caulobacter]PXA77111.1 NADP-dependent oxidoreductase [Caulobacter sp. D4A]PXA91844.1 NADP-dependent oxidoreductase [Caulobacter sp. D5]